MDSGVAAIERQIRRNKTRLEKKLREGALEAEQIPAYVSAAEEEEKDEFKIVRSKRFSIKPMSPEEAILQMNLLDHTFFMFKNAQTGVVNVVYKRDEGNYAVLVPEDE